MTLEFMLNGETVMTEANAGTRLIDILRGPPFSLIGAKAGCLIGVCGACSVIYNGKVIKACLIPAFRVPGSDIITIEGFSKTDEYQDILNGFEKAGVIPCGYCNTGKILMVQAILAKNRQPTRNDILPKLRGIRCRCTEPERLIEAVLASADIRQRRIYGRTA